jgi:hypothetical protein
MFNKKTETNGCIKISLRNILDSFLKSVFLISEKIHDSFNRIKYVQINTFDGNIFSNQKT